MADVTNYTTMDLANMILQEKTNKITPENIRHDVQIFDIVGNYEGDTGASYRPQRIQFTGVGLNGNNYSYGDAFIYPGRNLDIFDVEHLDTSNAININYSFYATRYITTLRGLSNWNTSNFNSLENGFVGAYNLQDISQLANWDTGNVLTMCELFGGQRNINNFDSLTNWNVSSCTNFAYMFSSCNNLSNTNFMNNWVFSSDRKNITGIFYGCNNLHDVTSIPDSFFNNFNSYNYYISSVFSSNITNFGDRNINGSYIYGLFGGNINLSILNNCYFSNSTISYITSRQSNKDTNFVCNINGDHLYLVDIFRGSDALNRFYYNQPDIGYINVDNVYAGYMFSASAQLYNILGIHFTNCNCTQYMFCNCINLKTLNNIDIHFASTYMLNLINMFENCYQLVDATAIDNWTFTDTSNQTRYMYINCMFYNCRNLSNESVYAITNFLINIAPNVVSTCKNLSTSNWNGPFVQSVTINSILDNTQLNRLVMAGYYGFGTY